MLRQCDYCGRNFNDRELGISAFAESGSVTIVQLGHKVTRSDGQRIDFCGSKCLTNASEKVQCSYTWQDCPLSEDE